MPDIGACGRAAVAKVSARAGGLACRIGWSTDLFKSSEASDIVYREAMNAAAVLSIRDRINPLTFKVAWLMFEDVLSGSALAGSDDSLDILYGPNHQQVGAFLSAFKAITSVQAKAPTIGAGERTVQRCRDLIVISGRFPAWLFVWDEMNKYHGVDTTSAAFMGAAWEALRALIVRDLLPRDAFEELYAPMRALVPDPA